MSAQLGLFTGSPSIEGPPLWEVFGAPGVLQCSWCGARQGHDRSRDPTWNAACVSLVGRPDRQCPDCRIAPTARAT